MIDDLPRRSSRHAMQHHHHIVTTPTSSAAQAEQLLFAGSPLGDFSQRAVALSAKLGRAPTAAEILADYYAGPHIPVHIWIGQKRPSVYGVPFLLNSRTSLYFLQFPTPLLDRLTWRRVLYDAMYIRGDDSELFPEDVPLEREVLGLGKLADGFWVAQQRHVHPSGWSR